MTRQTSLVVSAVILGLWLVSFALVLLSSRKPVPRASRATTELRGESPAVVSLLINGWEPGGDLAEAILLDLASRGHVMVKAPLSGERRATITTSSRYPGGLKEYEQLTLDRVGSARDPQFLAKLAVSVLAEARDAGLWHQRMNPQALAWLGGGAVVAAAVVGFSIHQATGSAIATLVALLIALTFGGLIAAAQRMQHTETGREAAAHWLGVRVSLRGAPDLPNLPTYALSEGDKWPAYGAALGVTHAISEELALDPDELARPWSPQGGWHRVRVRYPKGRDHFGRSTVDIFQQAGLRFVIGAAILAIVTWVPLPEQTWVQIAGNFGLLAGAFLVAWALYLALRNLLDLTVSKQISGVVVARSPWRRPAVKVPLLSAPETDYLAVDDGRDDDTVAWALPAGRAKPAVGETVRLTVHPWTRRVV